MARMRPISDDKWDSWEPLVAGVPLFLRLILLQYAFAIVACTFLLFGCLKWLLEGPPGPPSSGVLRAAIMLSAFTVYSLLVWSWLEAYKAKRWAIAFWGFVSIAGSIILGIGCAAVFLALPTDRVLPNWLPLETGTAALLAAWGFVSIAFGVMLSSGCAAVLRALSTNGMLPNWLPVALGAAALLAAVEGVYLFRLRAKLKRLGLL